MQQDSATAKKTMGDTMDYVVQRILSSLRSPVDSKGNPKSPDIFTKDEERAKRVEYLEGHLNIEALVATIYTASKEHPQADLGNVISHFLHDQLMAMEAQSKSPASQR